MQAQADSEVFEQLEGEAADDSGSVKTSRCEAKSELLVSADQSTGPLTTFWTRNNLEFSSSQ